MSSSFYSLFVTVLPPSGLLSDTHLRRPSHKPFQEYPDKSVYNSSFACAWPALRDEHVMEVDMKTCRFVSDDFVRVTDGPFEGVIGRVARVARQNRVVVYIEGLQAGLTTAYIPPYYLEKVTHG